MLLEILENFQQPRKGLSFFELKRHLNAEYGYDNMTVIKRTVKALITSGEIIQVTGVGLTGSFKLPPKKQTRTKKKAAPAESPTPSGSVRRRGSKPVNDLTETKQNKKRKSLSLKAVKTPKVTKKGGAAKESKGAKAKNATVVKGTKSGAKAVSTQSCLKNFC